MDIAIAGAHGQIARRLTRLLVARGDSVRGLIRNPDHAADVRADGADPTLCDLESAAVHEVALAIEGADSVVFAAGAGPGSGAERKATMDRDGALLLLEAAISARVPGYVIVSSMGTEDPPQDDDVFSVYLRAKAAADRAVMDSDRQWTVLRPGVLTDDPGSGRVRLARRVPRGPVSRDDVAAVLAAVLHDHRTGGRILSLVAGEDPIDQALEAALTADPRDD
ncbi:SDR family oxidoreductase [Patulibacter defluvii]|uniref:SDR family oxidoreductase n=1 Tax=Patulibacter defluvii TaxID=3095358 RepID=UPI002A75F43B|nr:SDR family oxidoreductase [Patulibacter sp. DM4]